MNDDKLGIPGARAKLQANFSKLGYSTSMPMLLRLFSTLVPLPSSMAVRSGGHKIMANSFPMPRSC